MAEKLLVDPPLDDLLNDASSTAPGKTATFEEDVPTLATSVPPSFPGGLKQSLLVIALMMALFLVGLDMVMCRGCSLVKLEQADNEPSR